MSHKMLNRSQQIWRKTILTLQVIVFSEATNSLISSRVVNTASSKICGIHRASSSSCAKFNFLPAAVHNVFSNQQSAAHGKVNDKIKMSSESYSDPSQLDATPTPSLNNNLMGSLPENLSVHTANITEVHNVPFKVLIRPFPSVLDEDKVLSLMKTLQNKETEDRVPPLDIIWVKGREGGDYYYSFGGCHRYEAYKRLKRETVPCKLFKSSVENLKPYLGASTPDLL